MVDLLNRTRLTNLLADQLGDLLHAENMLLKALPKLVQAAAASDLKELFGKQLTQSRSHATQVEKMLTHLERPAREKKCESMMGLLLECQHLVLRSKPSVTADQALISAARKIKAFQKVSYESVASWAGACGYTPVAKLAATLAGEEEAGFQALAEMQQRALAPGESPAWSPAEAA